MKRRIIVFSIFACLLAACNKEYASVRGKKYYGTGCIERVIIPRTQHAIDATAVQTVNDLFKSNHINNSSFRYYYYIHDSLQTYYPPYARLDEKVVSVNQYANGLRIFTGDMSYVFLENKFDATGGKLTSGTSLDTKPHLSLDELRTLFLNSAEEFDNAGDKFKDTCLSAEFGYYDINAGTSYTPEKLVKAWRVVIKNSELNSQYPQACYQDNGALIYYDNGIRTFK